jgi:hypothetical protein
MKICLILKARLTAAERYGVDLAHATSSGDTGPDGQLEVRRRPRAIKALHPLTACSADFEHQRSLLIPSAAVRQKSDVRLRTSANGREAAARRARWASPGSAGGATGLA